MEQYKRLIIAELRRSIELKLRDVKVKIEDKGAWVYVSIPHAFGGVVCHKFLYDELVRKGTNTAAEYIAKDFIVK